MHFDLNLSVKSEKWVRGVFKNSQKIIGSTEVAGVKLCSSKKYAGENVKTNFILQL